MAIKDFFKREESNEEVLETGTKDKVLDSLRKEDIKFDEAEEKEVLKERLRQRKQQFLRKNVFGLEGDIEEEVDINHPTVNVNKTDVNIMNQKNLMNQENIFKHKNLFENRNTILNQPNLISKGENRIKKNNIRIL